MGLYIEKKKKKNPLEVDSYAHVILKAYQSCCSSFANAPEIQQSNS